MVSLTLYIRVLSVRFTDEYNGAGLLFRQKAAAEATYAKHTTQLNADHREQL